MVAPERLKLLLLAPEGIHLRAEEIKLRREAVLGAPAQGGDVLGEGVDHHLAVVYCRQRGTPSRGCCCCFCYRLRAAGATRQRAHHIVSLGLRGSAGRDSRGWRELGHPGLKYQQLLPRRQPVSL